ncbi:MAG: hypothetical protein QNJ46_11995 [Leptolyngbyaceae cyanobacterium MO_188.B28]|nr:hypothetical protein [Leptolyngbyaceae cyanobacterium MO_188.B28]
MLFAPRHAYEPIVYRPEKANSLHYAWRCWSWVTGCAYFFDIAGLESLEWYIMWPFLTVLAAAVVLPIIGGGAVIVYAVSKRC